ncbi:ArsR/SmtB family transcription factor [Chrysiogenes arsenatis]|uniref:ArsR/SmtB family transcription factor n=1 Tax=Chrysiogenes arsenatis TaxID=309797 RepID=UPI000400DCFC|nr:metalloregulator ArsR/SmtB family transcription factor [Chrysiogenes arsenatis]
MSIVPAKDYEHIAWVAKALAHPTRLLILEVISRERLCVQELVALVGCDQSTVSKHLSVLSSVGVIEYEKEGQKIYYSVKNRCILNFFTCARVFLEEEGGPRR